MTTAYVAPTTLDDALAALAAGARPVAGGTDLVVGARQGKAPLPDSLVAIHGVAGLDGLDASDDVLTIGALVSHERIASDEAVRDRFTALADASAIVGSHATRAQGTLGGNVMNASPAMETGGPLICFGAIATLSSARGSREVEVDGLFTAPGRTTAEPDELLVAVAIPMPAEGTGSAYVRLEYRRQMEIAVVGATAVVTIAGGQVTDARIAITALAPTIQRVQAAEAALVGSDGARAAVDAAAAEAAAAATPISDVRASEEYRRAMTVVIARRAIETAITRATGGSVAIPASESTKGSK